MENKKITFEAMPSLIESLIKEVSEMKALVTKVTPQTQKKRLPIGIEQACQLISKAKPTVYTLVRKGLIPHFKQGKKLYFFEDELIQWIEEGKRRTHNDITIEAQKEARIIETRHTRPHRY